MGNRIRNSFGHDIVKAWHALPRAPSAPCPRTVRAPDIALPHLVPALHRAPSAHSRYRAPAPCPRPALPPLVHALHRARPRTRYRAPAPCPRPPPRTVRAPDIALPPLVPALHRAPSAHPISRSRPLSPPSTAHRAPPPRTVLPPLVHALHRAPSAHPISRSRPLSPPSTVHLPRTRYRAPAPCPRPPPRTVRAPDIVLPSLVHALHRAPSVHPISRAAPCPRPPPRPRTPYAHPNRPRTRSAHPIRAPDIKARAPFSLLKLFRQDRARYRAPRVGALNENPTPEGFSGIKSRMT